MEKNLVKNWVGGEKMTNIRYVYVETLQMVLRGPRASLSSNYSSVLVTCRKVSCVKKRKVSAQRLVKPQFGSPIK